MILLSLSPHDGLRLAELGFALAALAGVALLFSALLPFGRKPGTAIAGLALAGAGVLTLVAVHWGHFS